ncbi:MAG: hypothetical protein AAGA41_01275 [Pseudomonadota bacterium]
MNQGVIFGTVNPVNDTIVRLDCVWSGHIANRLNVVNPSNGLVNNLGLAHADPDDRFLIPFEWHADDARDFMAAEFRVTGFDTVINRFDTRSGRLRVGCDWRAQFHSAVTSMIEAGIWEITQMSMAPVIQHALRPASDNNDVVAVGAAHLDI